MFISSLIKSSERKKNINARVRKKNLCTFLCLIFDFSFFLSSSRMFLFTSLQFHLLVKRCELMQRFELFIRSIPVGHTLSEWKCETEHYIHLWLFRYFFYSLPPLDTNLSHVQISFFPLYYFAVLIFFRAWTYCKHFHIVITNILFFNAWLQFFSSSSCVCQ